MQLVVDRHTRISNSGIVYFIYTAPWHRNMAQAKEQVSELTKINKHTHSSTFAIGLWLSVACFFFPFLLKLINMQARCRKSEADRHFMGNVECARAMVTDASCMLAQNSPVRFMMSPCQQFSAILPRFCIWTELGCVRRSRSWTRVKQQSTERQQTKSYCCWELVPFIGIQQPTAKSANEWRRMARVSNLYSIVILMLNLFPFFQWTMLNYYANVILQTLKSIA